LSLVSTPLHSIPDFQLFFYFSWLSLVSRSKAWTVFTRSNAGIVGSNPTQGMDVSVRLFCV
jgi:hypothetical protein